MRHEMNKLAHRRISVDKCPVVPTALTGLSTGLALTCSPGCDLGGRCAHAAAPPGVQAGGRLPNQTGIKGGAEGAPQAPRCQKCRA